MISQTMDEGREIYEFTESAISITEVGLKAMYNNEGYVLLCINTGHDLNIYRYTITLFERSEEKYKGVHFHLVEKKQKSIFETHENIKVSLTRKYKDLPNPATYAINCSADLPYDATVLPVAKRLLVRYVDSGEQ
jgi:hypothetical protein